MASDENSLNDFGLFIGYVIPGYTAIHGFPLLTLGPDAWGAAADSNQSIAAFLSTTLVACAAGLTVSAVRWLTIDTLHRYTGVRPPPRDFARLEKRTDAFIYLVQVHYRYYKFYANSFVALIVAFANRGYAEGWPVLPYLALAALFLFASRDSLKKYHDRVGQLLQEK